MPSHGVLLVMHILGGGNNVKDLSSIDGHKVQKQAFKTFPTFDKCA